MEINSTLHADKDVKILIPEDVKIVKLRPRQQQEAKGAAHKSLAALVGIEMFRRPSHYPARPPVNPEAARARRGWGGGSG